MIKRREREWESVSQFAKRREEKFQWFLFLIDWWSNFWMNNDLFYWAIIYYYYKLVNKIKNKINKKNASSPENSYILSIVWMNVCFTSLIFVSNRWMDGRIHWNYLPVFYSLIATFTSFFLNSLLCSSSKMQALFSLSFSSIE